MPVIKNSVILPCSPQVAFDYLSDPRSELEWNPKCESMEKLSEGAVGPGAEYRAKWRGSPYLVLHTVAFDPPYGWTMHNGGPIEVTFSCRLEGVPEGTRLHAAFTPIPHGWFRLVFPIFLIMIRRDEKANMGHLRKAVERRAQAPA